eukprot:1187105-Prorocentrum_minimum.AAC.10
MGQLVREAGFHEEDIECGQHDRRLALRSVFGVWRKPFAEPAKVPNHAVVGKRRAQRRSVAPAPARAGAGAAAVVRRGRAAAVSAAATATTAIVRRPAAAAPVAAAVVWGSSPAVVVATVAAAVVVATAVAATTVAATAGRGAVARVQRVLDDVVHQLLRL